MDILVFGAADRERALAFQDYARAQGHQPLRVPPGGRLPATDKPLLGAVIFDSGAAVLGELLRGPREQLRYLGIALVVVSSQEMPANAPSLLEAGTEIRCAPGTPDAVILQELTSRRRAQPVPPESRDRLAEPLVIAVRQTLTAMAEMEVDVRSIHQRRAPIALGDIAATLAITAPVEGALTLSFSKSAAEALARRILAEVPADQVPVLIPDCMGEIANVVAGQAKALLAGTQYHFIFATPIVTSAPHEITWKPNLDALVIAFESACGGLALQLCRAKSAATA